ncbi:MAG: 30S ribosomal protein S5 [Sulfolobales archaeon]
MSEPLESIPKETAEWIPRTRIGRLVKEGKIVSLREIFEMNEVVREPEIVDYLLGPELKHEILSIDMVQKMTDAGRRTKFRVVVVVGNMNGYVGLGIGKASQLREAIDKAIKDAKLNIIPVRRGCGSWECSCGEPHSVPFTIEGKSGSVRIILKPAPKGTGLVAGEIPKIILKYAGLRDVWTWSRGKTSTSINFAKATFDAIKKTYKFITTIDWVK